MTAVDVTVRTPDARLDGRLAVFPGATAVVAFAHGSGSSRHSPRNRAVAEELNRVGVATLLLDLLTPEEERADSATGRQRFDIDLLTRRLTGTVDWLAGHEDTAGTPIGLFGASTGAAAALRTAAERPDLVAAVVSRGGRPDLAGTEALQVVRAPTLLVVGGADTEVLRLNEEAADRLSAPHRIHVVPRATHLFEEPGALEEVADAASGWFAGILGEAER
ncbi:dienelactone hydrolase family protein [Nocardiopsis dassonvillei]|uniref:dienelactone hydrolase family protein n=1 Tax=Nocardiopsis dassonvillei TaxID=2014 RepID=UPI000B9D72C4|nr:alpha/beta family hydrolase [Nocardiopsis dassonvillei]ASU57785.1 alpha/beta hydrolase [Nocardiopsis dassonvillei]